MKKPKITLKPTEVHMARWIVAADNAGLNLNDWCIQTLDTSRTTIDHNDLQAARWTLAADEAGLTMTEWCKRTLDAAAKAQPPDTGRENPADGQPEPE